MSGRRGLRLAPSAALALAALVPWWDTGSLRAGPAAPDVLDCATVAKGADEAALARRFGRTEVTAVDLDGAEGQTDRGAALHARDPLRRLDVFWSDPARRRRPASLVIRDRSRWRVRLPGGATLGLGAGLAEVETANGRPFAVSGFFWDQGGFATDWKGGTLPRLDGGCTLSVRFNPDPKASGRVADRVSGEKTFPSSSAALRAVSPTVSVLSVDWPE